MQRLCGDFQKLRVQDGLRQAISRQFRVLSVGWFRHAVRISLGRTPQVVPAPRTLAIESAIGAPQIYHETRPVFARNRAARDWALEDGEDDVRVEGRR